MTISALSACSFQSRGLIPAGSTVRRYLSYNRCLIKKRLLQRFPIGINSRKYSYKSLTDASSYIIDTVVSSSAFTLSQNFFISFHDAIGLPWWCVVVTSAAILKISFFPLKIYQMKLSERYRLVGIELQERSKNILHEIYEKQKFYNYDQKKAERLFRKEYFLERRKLVIEKNCSPFRTLLLGYIELPFWTVLSIMWRMSSYGFSSSITTSKQILSEMMVEGPIWCSNLTVPDPFHIIPLSVLLLILLHTQLMVVSTQLSGQTPSRITRILFHISRIFGFVLGFAATILPNTVGLFWASSSVFNIVRVLVLTSRKTRRLLGLSYQSYSHRDLLQALKTDILTKLKIKGKKA